MTDAATAQSSWTLYRAPQRWWFLFILVLVSLSNYADRHVMSVLIEPIKAEFQVSDTAMGVLTGFAFAVTYAVLGIPVARWADRGDRRVVITASLAVWSLATIACGFAKSFWLLAAARLGVGVGEAGAVPPAQSLIADYFPPDQRTRAFAIFMTSTSFGYLVAFIGGSAIAAAYGWRWAFIALGAPGLLLALLTAFGLKEPRQQLAQAGGAAPAGESLREALRQLAAKRSYVLTVISMILYFLVAYGALTWIPAYLGRVLQFDPVSIGAAYGLASMGGTLVGTLSGGWVTDYIGKRGSAGFASVPGVIMIACWPFFQAMLMTESITIFIVLSFIGGVGIGAAAPAMFSVTHLVCGSVRRSMAVAVAFFFSNLVGLGIGPVITGALSDMFTAAYGPVGLRYALMVAMTMLLPAGLALYAASRFIEREIEE